MNNAIDNSAKRNSILKWILVIAVNAIVAITVILMSVFYSIKQNNLRYADKEQNFSTNLDAIGQTAYQNLYNEQVYCNNWSSYINFRYVSINEKNMTLTEVGKFIGNINTEAERVMMQVIDYDQRDGGYEGFYVAKFDTATAAEGQSGDNQGAVEKVKIKYNTPELLDAVGDALEESKNCQGGSHLHITRPFKNPVDGKMVIGFCHRINAIDDYFTEPVPGEDITTKPPTTYALFRLIQVDYFYGQWIPTSFNKTRLAVIDRDGEFVVPFHKLVDGKGVQSDKVTEANFFDYLTNKTDAGQEKVNTLKKEFETVLSPNSGIKDFRGELKCTYSGDSEGFYSYYRLKSDEEWVIVGLILHDELNVIRLDVTLAVIVVVGLAILITFDGTYLFITNRRLRKSMQEIKYANEAKTRFLSSMSHDIRTPMNAIIGMTTIAVKRIDDKHQVEECLRQITRASNHLLTLINDVLDISKVESGKLSLNPTVFSLADLMGNIISITQPHIKEKKMEFEIHARNIKYEYIFADELRLNQILINIISNAIKYTPEEGKVLVRLEERPSPKGQNVVELIFDVTDTGIGISEEFMKTMYDTFSRDVDSRINTIQGAGLGLAIVKQMVDMMGGKIDVKSKVGEGTTFTITLDLPIAEKVTEDYILPPLRLLVVDDDELFLESAEDTLKSLGLNTETVNNGAGAVKMVEDKHVKGTDYHCVIVDWKMPDMDGVETIRAIRKIVGEEVSVIIISAYDWTEIEEEAMKAGANGFITKPLFRSSVYNKLNELLNLNGEKEKKVKEVTDDDLKGMHLLIAEDNEINWDIIQVMLEFHGITAERAENGQVCVDMINSAPDGKYAAILMDVQMPIMNGKDATRAIRAAEREYVKNIPIIAMTADAFTEDIIACKEAGMNGHVAKPLDMKKLIKELRSALGHDED